MDKGKESEEAVTRSTRSRSRTPGLLNLRVSVEKESVNGDGESHPGGQVKKVPSVDTIEEELSSSQKSATGSGTRSSTRKLRTVTSDYSSDDISPEKAPTASKQSTNSTVTIMEQTVTVTTSSINSSSEKNSQEKVTKSPSKKEVRQNETNRVLEDTRTAILRTSTPKEGSKRVKKMILTPEELKQHAAYREYKEAGEYWNKFPKTDYTYSELSPHRRELEHGLVAMPNMSRPGLNKHAERINVMIQRNPTQESYIRQRYAASKYSSGGAAGGSFAHSDPYDSGEEQLDLSRFSRSSIRGSKNVIVVEEHHAVVSRFFLSIINFFYSCAHTISRVFRKSDQNLYYTRIEEEQGFFGRIFSFFNTLLTSIFKKVYLLISSVLFLDTWLLQTSADDVKQGQRKRKFLLFLLILLPFLLFGAFLLAEEDQTIVLPASKRATIALSSISGMVPSLSAEDLDAFQRTLLAKLDWRELQPPSFSWATLVPTFSWNWRPSFGSGSANPAQYERLKSQLQSSLTKQEYEDLMSHIDSYIERLLTEKFLKRDQEETQARKVISPEVTIHVANVVQENLATYNYKLSQSDVELVAEKVRLQLLRDHPDVFNPQLKTDSGDQEKSEKLTISEENLVEIQRLIKQQISITNNNFIISDQQLEDILLKILSSEKLVELIDSRILLQSKDLKSKQETQEALIENLKNEINEIKNHFTEKLAAGSLMVEDNLKKLRLNQDQLADQVRGFRIENDEKYVKLLADIDARLAAVNQERFSGLNEIIKKNIVTILGLNVQEDFSDEDLKTWISNLFVAKDYLENRLKEYQAGVNAVIQQEMERSAATLMKDVSEKIQKEILAAIQTQKSEINLESETGRTATTGSGGSGLSEDDVRRIVRDSLRIYDADKTGLVDYALESAGGQILSTRCTENYHSQSAQISIFGIPLWYPTNTPRTVISPTMQPGQCWAFSGFPGYLGPDERKRSGRDPVR
ncbi:klaroid protein isoform X2 [Uranotaenia lowii]|uniref:klaroid protein isoform X2 n=1 Tax=Uranotaenia lowii TaxID=190385 RepID=UPI002479144B|nr:klaroid protein isoform X2 [Uranotaenia lowii]